MNVLKKKFKSQIYCDTADFSLIKKLNRNILVKGFTTNPSLMKIAGAKNYKKYAIKLLKICNKKPISLEVFADEENAILEQANIINSWGKNIYVKIPVMDTKGRFLGKVIEKLSSRGLKLNITAVYDLKQVQKILKVLNKKSNAIISIFVGRMADAGKDPVPEIIKSISMAKKFKNVEILWASVREPYNFLQAKELKCNIITIPPSIIEKIEKFGSNSFEKLTTDTVKGFLIDSKKSRFKI